MQELIILQETCKFCKTAFCTNKIVQDLASSCRLLQVSFVWVNLVPFPKLRWTHSHKTS